MSVLLSLLIWMLVALESDEFDSDESVSGPIGGSQPNVSELSGTGLV